MSQSCRWRVLRTPPPPSPLLAIKFRCVCERACPLLGGTNSNSKSSQTPPFLPGAKLSLSVASNASISILQHQTSCTPDFRKAGIESQFPAQIL